MRELIDGSIGWLGTFLVLFAYILISFGYLSSSAISYQWLNLLGAFGIMYIAFKKKVYQSVTVNLVWGIIAAIAIIKILI
ncbi:MAG: hypothetical protein AABX93_01320 [Nanoarchaeota archaeon]